MARRNEETKTQIAIKTGPENVLESFEFGNGGQRQGDRCEGLAVAGVAGAVFPGVRFIGSTWCSPDGSIVGESGFSCEE